MAFAKSSSPALAMEDRRVFPRVQHGRQPGDLLLRASHTSASAPTRLRGLLAGFLFALPGCNLATTGRECIPDPNVCVTQRVAVDAVRARASAGGCYFAGVANAQSIFAFGLDC